MLVNLDKSKRKRIVVLLYSELWATPILFFRINREDPTHAACHSRWLTKSRARNARVHGGVWNPPGGRRVFHMQSIDISRAICACGTFLHSKTRPTKLRNAATRRQLCIENHGFHVASARSCAPSGLPLHANLQLSLSVIDGRTTSPVMPAKGSMSHAHGDLVLSRRSGTLPHRRVPPPHLAGAWALTYRPGANTSNVAFVELPLTSFHYVRSEAALRQPTVL